MKRCSTSYITRDMQSKITMRYHYKSIRVALANKGFGQHQCRPGRGETGTLIHCWWERKVLHWKAIWRFLTKLNMFLPYQPWYLPKGVKKLPIFPNKILHMSVYNSFIHNYQILEGTKITFNRQMAKSTVVHPDNGILFSTHQESYQAMKRHGGSLNPFCQMK